MQVTSIGVIILVLLLVPSIAVLLLLPLSRECVIRRPLAAVQLFPMVKLLSLKNCLSRKEKIMYRRKLSRRGSKRLFTATALKINRRNVPHMARGGIRF